eukprot:COSAG02_NODE_798_length_17086_cov_72.770295_7_plen_147_part_00
MFVVGAGARESMGGSTHTVFAKRWITREPNKCSELEMPVTAEEMDRKSDMCELALFWEAHDTMYAVGNEIKGQLAQGLNVVINVSRTCKQPVAGYAVVAGFLNSSVACTAVLSRYPDRPNEVQESTCDQHHGIGERSARAPNCARA